MVRHYFIIFLVILFAGCAAQKGLMQSAEDTAASKTMAQLTPLNAAPAEGDKLFIDDSGTSKSITALYLMRLLESELTSYAMATENMSTAVKKSGASCYFYNNGDDLTADLQCRFRVPFKHTLNTVILTSMDAAGTAVIDVIVDELGDTAGLGALSSAADSLFNTASNPSFNAASDRNLPVSTFDGVENIDIPSGSYYIVNLDSTSGLLDLNVDFDFTKKD